MAKKEKPRFYEYGYDSSGVQSGVSITVGRSLRYLGQNADFTPFLGVPIKELEQRLKASEAEEKKVLDEMKKAIQAWDEHGAQSLLLWKAIEYLKIPTVKHTANEWKEQKDGSWEISNLTYKMTFSIVRDGNDWKLSWELSYTAPGLAHGYWGYVRTPRERIDHEGSKKYKTLEGAQKYIQQKFDQYSHCFDTLSPPVPQEAKDFFCVNGQLLQGYTLARPKVVKKEVTLTDLIESLEDDMLQNDNHDSQAAASTPEPAPVNEYATGAKEAPPKSKPASQPVPKKKALHKKKPALVR